MTAPITNTETAMVIMILRKNAVRLRQIVEAHKQVAYDAHAKLYKAEAEIDKLKELTPVWVSVDEQLPNEEGHYLLYHPSWHVEVGLFYQGQLGTIGLTYDDPTHWMPIPPAPEKAK